MDFRRAFAALLILASGAASPLPLREAQWIVPEQRVAVLSEDPAICVALPESDEALGAMLVGAAAFRTPLLLGGQAARAGLSCQSCHRGGGGNPAFRFPGLSDRPGTADVTSSILSSHRGDRMFNPRPIPDLARDPPKISRDATDPALEHFIRGLIVEEFDGPEPPAAILAGLAAYVRTLGAPGCRNLPARKVSGLRDLAIVDETVSLAEVAAERGDPATSRLLLSSARTSLGAIHERFGAARFSRERAAIEALDERLGSIQSGLGGSLTVTQNGVEQWRHAAAKARGPLIAGESGSLYNQDRLEAALR